MTEHEEALHLAPTADVSPEATVGAGSRIWHLAQVREEAVLGQRVTVGRGAYIGPGVVIGSNVKIQNSALVYEPAVVADGVFIGPAVVLTNDQNPRAVTPDGRLKGAADWHSEGVVIGTGASIGARAVCIGPVQVGEWAMVGAGAVVRHDVPPHALVVGVPARQIGWVGRAGVRLERVDESSWTCPSTHELYVLDGGQMTRTAE